MAGTERELREWLPVKKGAFVGACAYLLGYLITYAVTIERVKAQLASMQVNAKLSVLGLGVAPWKITGWFYYRAQFVDVATRGSINVPLNLIEFSADDPYVFLFALPPILLIAAGALTARLVGAKRRSVAAAAGLTVIPGYFALSFVGALLVQISILIAAVGPAVTTALAAGFLYPLVFGPLGGVLAATIQRSRASNSPHGSNP